MRNGSCAIKPWTSVPALTRAKGLLLIFEVENKFRRAVCGGGVRGCDKAILANWSTCVFDRLFDATRLRAVNGPA